MGVTAVVLMAALSGSAFSPGAAMDFPGGFFDTRVRENFQRYVMASWPGPTELMRLWRDGDLSQEEASLPDYIGVKLIRSPNDCFGAVERLFNIGDLDLLVTAHEQSHDRNNQIALLKRIEAVSLSRFLIIPTGNMGWGKWVIDSAFRRLDGRVRQWRNSNCQLDGEAVLKQNLRSLGAKNKDPLGPNSDRLWLAVLEGTNSRWWAFAARRLYASGGPWYELSVLWPDSKDNERRRKELAAWYSPKTRTTPKRNSQPKLWIDR